jgi:ligand-binding sensor domain-containing protein
VIAYFKPMLRHRLFFYFLLQLGIVHNIFGQTIPTKMISLDNGLSQSVVKAIIQDNDGYLWFGTEYGLNRYDGKKNEAFYNHHGLSSNEINCLVKDANGVLWIGTNKGVTIRVNDKFVVFEGTDSLINSPVNTIAFSKDGAVWIGTEGDGIWIYNGYGFEYR